MGLLGWIIVAIVIGGIIKAIKKARKQREEKQRLLSIPCGFNDGISQEQFSMIAKKAAGDVDRISETTVDEAIVYCTVQSLSKLSEWYLKLDFNDFGHLSGRYWISSDNEDSNIPKHVAENIRSMILSYPKSPLPATERSNASADLDEIQYCPYCGKKTGYQKAKYCTCCGAPLQNQ